MFAGMEESVHGKGENAYPYFYGKVVRGRENREGDDRQGRPTRTGK